jgi:hypothetical protein
MKYTMVMAAVLLAGATFTVSSAQADMYAGPVRNGDQCWVYSPNGYHFEYGYWGPCPEPAAHAMVRHHRHVKSKA